MVFPIITRMTSKMDHFGADRRMFVINLIRGSQFVNSPKVRKSSAIPPAMADKHQTSLINIRSESLDKPGNQLE
jgi:hypothetical protein